MVTEAQNVSVSRVGHRQPTLLRFAAYCVLLLTAFCCLRLLGSFATTEPFESTELPEIPLYISEADLDIGSVPEAGEFHRRIRVCNVGNQPLQVDKVNASCGCTSLHPSSFIVAPQGTQDVDVSVRHYSNGVQAATLVDIALEFISGPKSKSYHLSGKVIASIWSEQAVYDFGVPLRMGGSATSIPLSVVLGDDIVKYGLTIRDHTLIDEVQITDQSLSTADGARRLHFSISIPRLTRHGVLEVPVRISGVTRSGLEIHRDLSVVGSVSSKITANPEVVFLRAEGDGVLVGELAIQSEQHAATISDVQLRLPDAQEIHQVISHDLTAVRISLRIVTNGSANRQYGEIAVKGFSVDDNSDFALTRPVIFRHASPMTQERKGDGM